MFTNSKIIGANTDPRVYHNPNALRGDPKLIMSASQLKNFWDCPQRWIGGYEDKSTPSTDWGNIVDCKFLAPHLWDERFAICPANYTNEKGEENKWDFKSKDRRAWRDAQGDKQIVKADEHDEAIHASLALKMDKTIAELHRCSQKQVHVTCDYEDAATGLKIPLKCMIDMVPSPLHPLFGNSLADLKTCANASPEPFEKQAAKNGYDLSGALYVDIYNAASVEKRQDFRFVIQENFDPWITGLRMLDAEFLENGRLKYQLALRIYAQALATKKWPSYEDLARERGRSSIDGFLMMTMKPWEMVV